MKAVAVISVSLVDLILRYVRGPQRPNVSKHSRSVSNAFLLVLEAYFSYFGVALKTFYRFGCLRGTLVVKKVLGGFFVSSESVSYTLWIR